MGKEKTEKRDKKERKEKKRRRRDSSSEPSSDDEEYKRRKAERLAKKVAKHLKKHGTGDGHGYTNEDNPFGDAALTERFVWGKKIEKQIAEGAAIKDLSARAEAKRMQERMEEIEKVKRRREQREAERAAMQEELELIQRERALAEAVELEAKEQEFHLEQAKVRARQRMQEGRFKPIDLLTNNLFLLEAFDPHEAEPYSVFQGLTLAQLKELHADIETYKELDTRDQLHVDFWSALSVVAEQELVEATKQEEIDRARMRGEAVPAQYAAREAGWHGTIDADVQAMLAGKRYSELVELEDGIQDTLDSGTAADPEYWAAVLKRVAVHKAKARLREIHEEIMRRHLQRMMGAVNVPDAMGWDAEQQQQQQPEAQQQQQPEAEGGGAAAAAAANAEEIELPEEEGEEGEGGLGPGPASAAAAAAAAAGPGGAAAAPAIAPWAKLAAQPAAAVLAAAQAAERMVRGEPRLWDEMSEGEQEAGEEGEPGQYSPKPLPPHHVAGKDVVLEEEDKRLLQLLRAQVKYREAARFAAAAAAAAASGAAGPSALSSDADRLYRRMVADPGGAARMLGSTNPLLRYVADAAPQRGELAMRSGAAPGVVGAADDEAERQFRNVAGKLMGDLGTSGDAPFGGEVQLDSQVYWWHEKYRPRRPKYFNRVHTGYEWNKYNQTHYDADNPPPKTVQGYKFNLFYSDLIDKSKTPTYKVEKDPTSPDGSTCILRFSAGPPYEDIAFRIVNKEWEYNHKKGFKCVFERGIMHLYFNFRRQRYRR